jgi:uncharacterized protein YjaZ
MSKLISSILNADNSFSKGYIQIINRAFTKASRTTRELLPELPDIDIVFYANPSQVVEQTGIGGNTENAHTIIIPLDPEFKISEKELFLVICHEIHHACRIAKFGDTNSLLKKIISEGLADQFQVEIAPNSQPVTYRRDITRKDLEKGLSDLRSIMPDGDYDYYEWFFGYGDYPNWMGYTLGNIIVERYILTNKKSASELVWVPAEEFATFVRNFKLDS